MRKKILLGSMLAIFFGLVACAQEPSVNLTFEKNDWTLLENETLSLAYTLSDESIFIDWISLNETVATVDSGIVTGISEGVTTIVATLQEGKIAVPVTIRVEALPPVLNEFTVVLDTVGSFELTENETLDLPVLEETGKRFLGWSDLETVYNENLIVTKSMTLVPVFEDLVTALEVTGSAVSGDVGSVITLSSIQFPFTAEFETVLYQSLDETIATVNEDGVVELLAPGLVTITAITEETGVSGLIVLEAKSVLDLVTVTLLDPLTNKIIDEVTVERGHRLNYTYDFLDEELNFIGWELEKTFVNSFMGSNPFIHRDLILNAVYQSLDSCMLYSGEVLITDTAIALIAIESLNPYFQCEFVDGNGDFFAYAISNPAELQALDLVSQAGILVNDITLPDPVSDMTLLPGGLGEVIQAIRDLNRDFKTDNINYSNHYNYDRFVDIETNFLPLGLNGDHPFSGLLLGNGFEISNLRIKVVTNLDWDGSYLGLIGYYSANDRYPVNVISHLGLKNAVVISNDPAGNLIGENISGVVSYLKGLNAVAYQLEIDQDSRIEGYHDVGGVIGEIDGAYRVHASYLTNRAQVKGVSDSGGVIGYVESGGSQNGHVLSHLYNYADITIPDTYEILGFGGVIGEVQDDDHQISYLYNYGNITNMNAFSRYISGVIGEVDSTDDLIFTHLYNYGNVITNANYVGGIIGRLDDDRHVLTFIYNYGDITGKNRVGGILGESDDDDVSYTDVVNYGNVTGVENVGGIIGFLDDDDIMFKRVKNYGDIEGETQVGGIVGFVDERAFFEDVENHGNITGDSYVGGIIGQASDGCCGGQIGLISVTNKGDVIGTGDYIGGIIGDLIFDSESSYTISGVANTASVSGLNHVGGLFGGFYFYDESIGGDFTFEGLSNSGTITGNNHVGGLFGRTDIYNSHFSMLTNTGDVLGQNNLGGIIGNFKGDFNQFSSLFNFGDVIGDDDLGGIIGEFSSLSQDNVFQDLFNSGLIESTTRNDASNAGDDIGGIVGLFSGRNTIFDTVTNTGIVLGRDEVGGFIGKASTLSLDNQFYQITNTGEIIGVINVGGIFGFIQNSSNNTFSAITNSGKIEGSDYIGGLMGRVSGGNQNYQNLLNTGQVTGLNYIGGFTGKVQSNEIIIENFNNTANISGQLYVSGVIGTISGGVSTMIKDSSNSGEIEALNDYAAGAIAYIESNAKDITIDSFVSSGSISSDGSNFDNIVTGDQTNSTEVTITP